MTVVKIINTENVSEYCFAECEQFFIVANRVGFGSGYGRTTFHNYINVYGTSNNELWIEIPEKEYSDYISKITMTNTLKGE